MNKGRSSEPIRLHAMTLEEVIPHLQAALQLAQTEPCALHITDAVMWHDLFLDKCTQLEAMQAFALEATVKQLLPVEWRLWQRFVYQRRQRQR